MNSLPPCSSRHARGFTLLELIISVALVLVLMLAVTKIFSITSTTIGATQGIAAATRDARAAQAVFARDIGAMANDSPFIWINVNGPSTATRGTFEGFRNAVDEKGDADGNPQTIDVNDDGKEGDPLVPGEIIQNYDVNVRNHRLDQFSFCARDRFTRQTGNSVPNTLVSSLTSSEAWIYYGPLVLPNNSGSFYLVGNAGTNTEPGLGAAQNNPNNYYASQWTLGRFAPLMVTPDPTFDIREGNPSTGTVQEYYPHTASLTPFQSNTASKNNTPASAKSTIADARYDLVGVSITDSINIVRNYTGATGWWENIMGSYLEVNPFIVKPINAATASHQVPIFLPACSQFIVEFAGDFCTQDNNSTSATYGQATSTVPDGIIDYAFNNGQKVIRWYGYPRDTDGTAGISILTATNNSDVVTVSDFVLPAGSNYSVVDTTTTPHSVTGPVPFEHASGGFTTHKSYAANVAGFKYFAAWGPDSIENPAIPRPKMYRITIAIDRPEMAGRSADPQTFEYIFNVP